MAKSILFSRLDSARLQFEEALKGALKGEGAVALLDFPFHDNVGDSAIWCGEVSTLRRLGVKIAYASTQETFNPDVLRALPPNVPIVFHGGGNLGDIWPGQEEMRRAVVEDFPDRRVIFMPQTVHFESMNEADVSADVYRRHSDLQILVRDRRSAEFLQGLDLTPRLCPDAAMSIAPSVRANRTPAVDIMVLRRTDREANDSGAVPLSGTRVDDWVRGRSGSHKAAHHVLKRAKGHEEGSKLARRVDVATLNLLANSELRRGRRMLSQGRVLVADRLHAVIIAALMDLPVVWVDNNYGKLESVIGIWLDGVPTIRRAEDFDSAIGLAEGLLSASGD